MKQLADFVIEHYYPQCQGNNVYADWLGQVVKRTAVMVASWQAQGFAHGVLNTDNMSILGLTIDYGPFGFLEAYNPSFVCNHSDHQGRYAFDQQPGIGLWNLTRLADALSSLINPKQVKAILATYERQLIDTYSTLMRQKFGLSTKEKGDHQLINQFLAILQTHKLDYTNSCRGLSNLDKLAKDKRFEHWIKLYRDRIANENNQTRVATMNQANPKFILRNYLAEEAIREAEDNKNYDKISILFTLLSQPFDEHIGFEDYALEAPDWAKDLSVSCSS